MIAPGISYEELYRRYYSRVLKYLRGMVGATEAEDLAQEVFIKEILKKRNRRR